MGAYVAATPVTRSDVMRILAVPAAALVVGGIWGQIEYSGNGEGEEGGALIAGGPVPMLLGDNFFAQKSLRVAVGADVTFQVSNGGRAIHNLRLGADNRYDTADDTVSNPDSIRAGAAGTLQFTFRAAGQMNYRCDFHPVEMTGTVTIAAAPAPAVSTPAPAR